MLGLHCSSAFRPPEENKQRKYIHSSSFKMALCFTLLLGFSSGVLGYFHYFFNKGHYVSGAETLIQTEINHIDALWPMAGGPQIIANLLRSSDNRLEKIYALQDKEGNLFLGNVQNLPATTTALGDHLFTFNLNESYSGQAMKGLYAAKFHDFSDGTRLMVALRISEVTRQYKFMQWLSLLIILLMVVVIFISFAISTFVVSRTNRIANTAQNIIETGDLSRRIDIDSNWDDMSYLASVLNTLFTRMENLVFSVRQVSDNIAHDMRTPLTRLRSQLEGLIDEADPSCNAAIKAKAEMLIADTDHLLTTFNALLRIGRLEIHDSKKNFAESDVKALMQDVIEFYEPYAEDKNIAISFEGEATLILCDHHLLFQAFANILDNALKFTPDNGVVRCAVTSQGNMAQVSISDSGSGIPENEKKRVFNRFFRGDKSRNSSGTGLGLALVAAIIYAHDGTIDLCDNNPGLIVNVKLPL